MFSFFHRNSYLQDSIPNGYVDIHSHLLPGIDDGAKTIQHTNSLLSGLTDIGFSKFITTPHIMNNVYENSYDSIHKVHQKTMVQLSELNVRPQLQPAAEYMLDDNFLNLLHAGPMLTLDNKHILIEMSYLSAPIQLFEIIFEIQVAGYTPVLAHPERYAFYHSNFSPYHKLKNVGCKFQINLLSLVGYYGEDVASAATKLLRGGLIDFAGSDVHHQMHLNSFKKKIAKKNIAPLKEAMLHNEIFNF